MAATGYGGAGVRRAKTNLKKGVMVAFRFWPNGTSDPATTGTTKIYGPGVASIVRASSSAYTVTMQHRHGKLMSFSGALLKATADTYGAPQVGISGITEGSTGATSFLLTIHQPSSTTTAYSIATDITASATTYCVCRAEFEQVL